jgi:hypothetical protein
MSNTTTTTADNAFTGLDECGDEYTLVADPAVSYSSFGLGGTAFYDDLPLTTVWFDYQETLTFVAEVWQGDRQSWR